MGSDARPWNSAYTAEFIAPQLPQTWQVPVPAQHVTEGGAISLSQLPPTWFQQTGAAPKYPPAQAAGDQLQQQQPAGSQAAGLQTPQPQAAGDSNQADAPRLPDGKYIIRSASHLNDQMGTCLTRGAVPTHPPFLMLSVRIQPSLGLLTAVLQHCVDSFTDPDLLFRNDINPEGGASHLQTCRGATCSQVDCRMSDVLSSLKGCQRGTGALPILCPGRCSAAFQPCKPKMLPAPLYWHEQKSPFIALQAILGVSRPVTSCQ